MQQLQDDLDRWLAFYNEQRSHQGYRTPAQAFADGLALLPLADAAR